MSLLDLSLYIIHIIVGNEAYSLGQTRNQNLKLYLPICILFNFLRLYTLNVVGEKMMIYLIQPEHNTEYFII